MLSATLYKNVLPSFKIYQFADILFNIKCSILNMLKPSKPSVYISNSMMVSEREVGDIVLHI